MKKAFTMIELVIVIVVIGIIAMVTIPKYDQNRVLIAAQQIATHIRYAQHLAMIDNRTDLIAKPAPRPATDPNGDQWWRERWTIAFTRNINGNRWGYSIYSDFSRNGSLNSPNEVAPDPQNPNRLLTASNILPANRINNKLNIGKTYGIKNVTFSGGCAQNGNQAISFDEKGRPFLNASTVAVGARANPSVGRIARRCEINIGDGDTNATSTNVAKICIEVETGYVTYGMERGADVPSNNARRGCNQFQ
jgi:carbamoyl-phosphate synthase large chain